MPGRQTASASGMTDLSATEKRRALAEQRGTNVEDVAHKFRGRDAISRDPGGLDSADSAINLAAATITPR